MDDSESELIKLNKEIGENEKIANGDFFKGILHDNLFF